MRAHPGTWRRAASRCCSPSPAGCPASFAAGLILATTGLAALWLRGWPGAGPGPAAAFRADPVALGCGLAVVLAVAIARLRFDPLENLDGAGRWRYWADGLEIADLGSVPDHLLQAAATRRRSARSF